MKPSITPPNLFSFATSELSQDAFICWLLSWAKPELQGESEFLNRKGNALLRALVALHPGKKFPATIEHLEITRQHKNIDVLAVINETYYLLIEDKTHTSNHSGQLQKYLDKLEEDDIPSDRIFPVYFKTGDQSSYDDVKAKNYEVFTREMFLEILRLSGNVQIESDIYRSYLDHLEQLETEVNSYSSLPLKKWSKHSWTGFFKLLQERFFDKKPGWGYVPQRDGGFMGFWWGFREEYGHSTEYSISNVSTLLVPHETFLNPKIQELSFTLIRGYTRYLQLEEGKLTFRIGVENLQENRKLRNEYRTILENGLKEEEDFPESVRAGKCQQGKTRTMAVMRLVRDYRFSDKDGKLDVEPTILLLERITAFYEKLAS